MLKKRVKNASFFFNLPENLPAPRYILNLPQKYRYPGKMTRKKITGGAVTVTKNVPGPTLRCGYHVH